MHSIILLNRTNQTESYTLKLLINAHKTFTLCFNVFARKIKDKIAITDFNVTFTLICNIISVNLAEFDHFK
jgi:hypothetical protein